MARQELLCVQALPAFALQTQYPQCRSPAADHDSAFVSAQDLAWRTRLVRDFGLPELEQVRLRLRRQISERPRPRRQSSDPIPNGARRLVPVNMAILLFYFRGVADSFGGLRTCLQFAADVIGYRPHEKLCAHSCKAVVQAFRG